MQNTVSSEAALRNSLSRLFSASVGVMVIRTREIRRAAEVIHAWASSQELFYSTWDFVNGVQLYRQIPEYETQQAAEEDKSDYTKPSDTVKNTVSIMEAMRHFETHTGAHPDNGLIMALQSADPFIEAPDFQEAIRQFNVIAYDNPNRMIFISPPSLEIPDSVADEFEIVDFKAPSQSELRDVWDGFLDDIDDELMPVFEDDDLEAIFRNGKGMTIREFEAALALAFVDIANRADEKPDEWSNQDIKLRDFTKVLQERKINILKSTQLLELMPEVSMDQVGGLDLLKLWLSRKQRSFMDIRARDAGIDIPKGVLAVGPPGTGKSLIAKATAAQFKLPLIKFDVGRVFGGLVGQSEGNMRAALSMVADMSPCVMLIDEIDKGFSAKDGSNDGGTTSRVFGTLLTWMQEKEEQVFIVATANNAQLLPPELVRKGRFNEIFAVNMPNPEERRKIAEIHFLKRKHKPSAKLLEALIANSEGFSGSEIEVVVNDSIEEAFINDRNEVLAKDVEALCNSTVPLSSSYADIIKRQEKWAKDHAKPASSPYTPSGQPATTNTTRKSRRPIKRRRAAD